MNASTDRTAREIFASRVFASLALSALFALPASARDLRIEHVTVVSPERSSPLRDATVVVRDDRIVSVGPASSAAGSRRSQADVIDGRNLYLTPGLIDAHVHTSDLPGISLEQEQKYPEMARALREQVPRSYLLFGYTTLIDLISVPEHIVEWNAHEAHPDLYFCGGTPIYGGYPMHMMPKAEWPRLYRYMLVEPGEEKRQPEGIDAAAHTPQAVVAQMKADGALCVKTFYERGFGEVDEMPVPRLETIRELAEAAHAAHLPLLIHANGTDAQAFAVAAEADIIVHGLWHWNREPNTTELTPIAKRVLDGVLAAHTGWQPTMQVLYGLRDLFDPDYFSDPQMRRAVPAVTIAWYRSPAGQWYRDELAPGFLPKAVLEAHDPAAARDTVRSELAEPIARNTSAIRYMLAHGGHILFGSDTPSAPTYANPPGLNGFLEMQRLASVGMSPAQIFRAATLANAEALGLASTVGTVEAGKRANLLLLHADPTQTVQAFGDIAKVIVRGRVLDAAGLAAH